MEIPSFSIQNRQGSGDHAARKPMKQSTIAVLGSIGGLLFCIALIVVGMVGCPMYNVYVQTKEGQALLAHAQSSKEIAVAEAKAKMESATLLAQAEVSRAEGVAKANRIIGESLRNNEAYLRYLWITDVAGQSTGKTVVYVPTEANLPILEATRIQKKEER